MTSKKTVVIGASPNPRRYAYRAVHDLLARGHEVVPVGIKRGEVAGLPIHNDQPTLTDVDTVTLYVGPPRQPPLYDYILSLRPQRIIFNPGTENPELAQRARDAGVEPVYACTLVMLSVGSY